MQPRHNVDPAEIAKFEALAQRWWDPRGEFRPLHELNPLRLEFVASRAPLEGRDVLDVGCGGGILAEAMARRGARVVGIDLAQAALEVAELHALDAGVPVQYRLQSAEDLARQSPDSFDVVTCMEMLEHVPEPAQVIGALARLVRPGGHVFISTINRTAKAFVLAIVGAEYVLRLLPRGTHEYERFIRPAELDEWTRAAGLALRGISGIEYNPLTRHFSLSRAPDVNYLVHLVRNAPGGLA
ncbi:MAG TPA: bifunctional 2-polyprenyl-6-hydroxyphenol methylase/3-demethylubiquinol 3-O-methyltransferase UbiG [Steroidobacteraceae bacterium]|nr:bifunctional 2-polyprenyl-6-hydroxyphenol methylase/3-demethylubiquinol 3-O-methyltransferase UbiG [Steroidobacteraceae bacterium]